MKVVEPQQIHIKFRSEFIDLIKKHTEVMGAEDVLAIVSNMVGQLIAYQDRTKYSKEDIMHMIAQNIEMGNEDAIAHLTNKTAGSA